MKRPIILLLIISLLTACQTQQPAPVRNDAAINTVQIPSGGTLFRVDGAQSEVGYIAFEEFLKDSEIILGRKRATGEANTRGVTQDISGSIVLDETNQFVGATFVVNLLTLKTNRVERDLHIQTHNLRSREFPVAMFVATGVEGFPDSYTVGEEIDFILNGEITIRNINRPISIPITASLNDDMIRGTGEIELKMTDFGFEPPSILTAVKVTDEFTIFIDLVALAQK